MAALMPPVVPHDCTRGSAYDCTAAAAHGTSDDCTGNRAAAELMRSLAALMIMNRR
jgi:hypothetical protein